MAVATVVVMGLPAAIVGGLSALGVLNSLWAGIVLAVALSLAFSSAGSAYWRRHARGDVLFSDLLLWGWLRRRRSERGLARADELLLEAGHADSAREGELLRELGAALDAEDPYLDGHSRRVARYVTMIGERMSLPGERVDRARTAAAIHDVGKLRVPREVVNKPGRLTGAEFELMKQHAAAGGAMVECLGDPAIAAAVRAHHERWDGSGYPDGLAGERIPVEARLISVADTFDAITSARPYRSATPHARALAVIGDEAGEQLDPEVARAFISCYSDRRGAALWAGLAAIPRQLAGRLSTSPAELSGVVAAAVTAPLVVVAAALGSAAMPARSDHHVAQEQAAVASGPTGTPQPQRAAPTVTTPSSAPAADTAPTPAPRAGAVAGATARHRPAATASATRAPSAAPVPAATVALPDVLAPRASPAPADPILPDVQPPPPATATPTPVLAATPTAPPEPTPTSSAEPLPTPEPPPLLPGLPPVFPTPAPPSHTKDDCKDGGWMDLGYPNQGLCIADAHEPRRR
jgi:HD-GYP domain-containing protein (c-di-GMP phosphodiesterase class II)